MNVLDKRKCGKDQATLNQKEWVRDGDGGTKLTLSSKSPSEIFTAFHNVEKFIGLRIIIFQSAFGAADDGGGRRRPLFCRDCFRHILFIGWICIRRSHAHTHIHTHTHSYQMCVY